MRPLRVVVSGSECTGKTTLARELAARFRAPWVAEFCRGYLDAKGTPLGPEDVEPIARGQILEADEAERRAKDLVVLDTDLVSTALYARHYYRSCPSWIEAAAHDRRADLYLLCAPDLPWAEDGQRDRGDRREELHALFEAALAATGSEVLPVTGMGAERQEAATRAVAAALERWRRRAPAGSG